ncbi:MAG: glycosyltransferase family 4 protein [archaeon]
MNILFITNQFNPPRSTGSGRSSSLIFKELKKRNHDVDLLIFDHASKEKRYKKTKVWESYRQKNILTIIDEFKKITDGEYDIIHLYGGGPPKYILPAVCGHFKKTKLVTTFNGTSPACWHSTSYKQNSNKCCRFPKNIKCSIKSLRKRFALFYPIVYVRNQIRRFYTKKYDRFFSLSDSLRTLFSKAGFDKSNIDIIPNFYDQELYDEVKNFPVQKKDKTIILYVGRIDKVKGVHNLIKAYKKINKKNKELRMIGDGSMKKPLQIKYGDDKNIKFLGKVKYKSKEFIRNFKEADIFVHPGVWPEPFGRTILEAAISKNAIIVSDIGAPPDVLGDKALKYPPHDIESLTEILIDLIENPEKRELLANQAHDYIIKNYNVENSIDKLEKKYKRLIYV